VDHQEKLEEERQLWMKRIEEFHASGLTVTQFCKVNDLSAHQIYYWKAKFAKKPQAKPVQPKAEQISPLVKVITKSVEKKSHLPDAKWVAELIKALHEVF
jgi:hypothetical protein